MKIDAFLKKHGPPTRSISSIVGHWTKEREVTDLLGTEVYAGVTVLDFAMGGQLNDALPDDVVTAMNAIFKNKVGGLSEARTYVLDCLRLDDSLRGAVSALQGRLGEFAFQQHFDGLVKLASLSNQNGWDAYVEQAGKARYVQIKVYANAAAVIKEMQEVNESIAKQAIMGIDGTTPVGSIDWAVNDDIYAEVKRLAHERGLTNDVMNIGADRDDLRRIAKDGIGELSNIQKGFFTELLGVAATAAVLHSAINAFLVYKGSKSKAQAIEDTIYSTAVTTGAAGVGLAVEYVLAEFALSLLGGPVSFVLVTGTGMGSRAILSRIADRRVLVRALTADNERMRVYIAAHAATVRAA